MATPATNSLVVAGGLLLLIVLQLVNSQPSSVFHAVAPFLPHHRAWIHSGKFQGDIDGIDADLLSRPDGAVLYNALRNKQLIWPDGIVPYEMDTAFTLSERRIIEKAFLTYRKNTCVRFEKHNDQDDYLYITKGYGCYSQVGRTGGRQEVSLGRGCLFYEIVVHELMHALRFLHEMSRPDRDQHIRIKWENIIPGMESQFEKIPAALQNTLGEDYDYRSILHYDSTAFSRNGQNTIETVVSGFTQVIGTAMDLSDIDISKINKLYNCKERPPPPPEPKIKTATTKPGGGSGGGGGGGGGDTTCRDHFPDCNHFKGYCHRPSFFFLMKSYCPLSCSHCKPK